MESILPIAHMDGDIDFRMGTVLLAESWAGGALGVCLAKIIVGMGQFSNAVVFLYVVLLGFIGVSMLVESLRAIDRRMRTALAP